MEFAQEDLRKGETVSPIFMAGIYSQLGERDEAFRWLEKAFSDRNGGIFDIKVSPEMDNIRDDPRFATMLKRMNLPE